MKAIITRQNKDGSYDDCGMNNRFLTGEYKTLKGLFRYGVPKHKGVYRVEVFYGDSIYGEPFCVKYIERF